MPGAESELPPAEAEGQRAPPVSASLLPGRALPPAPGSSPGFCASPFPRFQEGRTALAGSGNANSSQTRGWVGAARRVCDLCREKKGLGNHWLLFVLNIRWCDGIGMQNYSDVTVCFAGDIIRLKSP